MRAELWWISAFVVLTLLGNVAEIIVTRRNRRKLLKQLEEEQKMLLSSCEDRDE